MAWRTLSNTDPNVPRLLIRTRFETSGYKIHITDLSRIWAETLDKKAISARADIQKCSIDASDDDNCKVLLEKIQSALNGEENTTLNLHSHPNSDGLEIHITAPLPRPLRPLSWIFELQSQSETTFSSQLVQPLLSQANNLRHQIKSLIEEIASKDRVISKITDRLETSGNDLTIVFPNASKIKRTNSRQKAQRTQLAEHVRGLGDFDEKAWRAQVAASMPDGELGDESLNAILSDLPVSSIPSESAQSSTWWHQLDQRDGISRQRSQSRVVPTIESSDKRTLDRSTNGISQEQSMNDQFQKQTTPPSLKLHVDDNDIDMTNSDQAHATKEAPEIYDDDSTEDEDDLDAPESQKSRVPETQILSQQAIQGTIENSQASPRKKVGAFDGEKEESPHPEPQQGSPLKPKSRVGAFGGKKKSLQPDVDLETASNVTPELATPEPPATAALKHRLGKFGGKTRPAVTSAVADDIKREDAPGSAPAKTSKLGTFGGRRTARSSAATTPDSDQKSRTPEVKAPSPIRETSEERQARRRDELKRMEAPSAKGPAKKKRKF